MFSKIPYRYWLVLIWAILIGTSLAVRPLFPVDETRYAAVAWEMWLRHDFLVPYLNGETYSHKPPLLFWLMQLSWAVFGVNDWSLRLISPLFSLASLFLSAAVARQLWPDRKQIAELTPLILLGSVMWSVYSTLTMFDMLLAFFALLGIYSLKKMATTGQGWWVLGLAIAGGVMSKGPVILLHVLPVALLAPLWRVTTEDSPSWSRWYLQIVFAIFLGAGGALCWAIPAGIAGGEAYRNAIFLGQTSGRIVQSFAHRLPWWWYLELLPVLLLPWLLFKPFWTGVKTLSLQDAGIRFCLAWAVPVFLAFSLVSGKRLHYLLPLFPAIALLVARAIAGINTGYQWQRAHLPIMLVLMLLSLLLMLLPWLNSQTHWRDELSLISPLWGGTLLLVTLGLAWRKAEDASESVFFISIALVSTLLIASGGYFAINAYRYDTRPAAEKIAQLLQAHKPVVYFTTKYHGQYQFTGRLTQIIPTIADLDELHSWAEQHDNGVILLGFKQASPELASALTAQFAVKGQNVGLVEAKVILAQPKLAAQLVP